MTPAMHAPTRPRKASASTRRHHRKYLPHRIRQAVPTAHTVIVLPIETEGYGPGEQEFTAVVRDTAGTQLKLTDGDSLRLASLLQGAFVANWTHAQAWRADTNELTAWQPPNVQGRWGW